MKRLSPYFEATPEGSSKRSRIFQTPGKSLQDGQGDLRRDRISVIDYKTGTDKEAEKEYISQLKNYIRILKEIYPDKKVEGVIAYVDLKEIRKV